MKIIHKCVCILKWFLAVVMSLVLLWVLTHQVITAIQKKNLQPIGNKVTVDNKQINVYSKGEGNHTIVLMSGLGTTAPVLDFAPLIDKLSQYNKVVVAEPFGYGWSDLTDKERTVENIIEEMRSALKEAGIPGPYILMPHSVSGIYAAYYADTYPDEVEGVVGIDCTLPTQVDYFGGNESGKVPSIAKLVCPLGISRLITIVSPESFISKNIDNTYLKENLDMQKKISSWKGYNKTVINEVNYIERNIETTKEMKFDSNLPLLFFTTCDSNKEARDDGKTSISFYETYITNKSCQKVIELDGSHYLHWNCSEEMTEEVESFFKNNYK